MLGEGSAQLETLVPQLLKTGRKNLVFDLSGLTHIDSTGNRPIHRYLFAS